MYFITTVSVEVRKDIRERGGEAQRVEREKVGEWGMRNLEE